MVWCNTVRLLLAARPLSLVILTAEMTALLALLLVVLSASPALAQSPGDTEFFEKKIRPIFAQNCQACHNPQLKTGGLDLSTAEGFVRGGQNGAVVSKANPGESRLLKVISYDERIKMPPMGRLEDDEVSALTTWVEAGAPWPGAEQVAEVHRPSKTREFTAEEKNYWAFQPVKDPPLPKAKNTSWARTPIDRFILAKLEENGLEPAPQADKATLLRRASYDLTGLPPTEKEIADFLADDSPQAFHKVVERLLASPRYGEQWGRHWLDVARYADSTGNDEDHRYPYAWRYRDYVIQAFNEDTPYDRFVHEQVAGDLLPSDKAGEINRRGIVATGFLALGPKAIAQQDKTKMLFDVHDEQLDVVSKTFMGLTVTCARCHDHKFDPILTNDYYSLIGMFAGTRSFKDSTTHVAKLLFKPLVPDEVYRQYTGHQDRIDNVKLEIGDVIDQELERYNNKLSPRLGDYMVAAGRVARGSTAAAEAGKAGLDEEILAKWVAYLGPKDVPQPHLEEWQQAPDGGLAEVAQRYQELYQERFKQWSARLNKWREAVRRSLKEKNMPPPMKPMFEPGEDRFFHEVYFAKAGPFVLTDDEQEGVFSSAARETLVKLREEEKRLNDTMPPEPDMACAVEEGVPVEQKVFIRGDYANPGEDAPKVFPAILEGRNQTPVPHGSGRLELARWLTKPGHPLTARVMANRIWYWHFGQGIVDTPSNFGKMGKRPTHPGLLDYLARRFVESGWSIKQMHRLIMRSAVYQLSGETDDARSMADPENRLLSHFKRRRLAVEEMRDGLLAMDGSLDVEMGGTLQSGFGTDRENSSDRLSLNPDDIQRRLVYLPVRRANLPPLLNLFDFGDATTSLDKRPQTNIAPQALFMMNSEFVAKRARNLARSLLEDEASDDRRRMERAYLVTVNRLANADELDSGLTYISSLKRRFPDATADLDAWQSWCRILMASNEFIYLE